MSSPTEARQERRRILLLFASAILPPLVLLSILAAVAARNDEAALAHVEQGRTRQVATRVEQGMRLAIERAHREVLDAVDLSLRDDPAAFARALEELRARKPLARRFVLADPAGELLWPIPELPFSLGPTSANEAHYEPIGNTVEDYQRRAELLARYDRAVQAQQAKRPADALADLTEVARSSESSAVLAARAAYRLGRCQEVLGDPSAARAAYAPLGAASLPVRDEAGRPLRVEGALRAAELLVDEDPAAAGRRALQLAEAVLRGARREDLVPGEWERALERATQVLREAEASQEAARVETERDAVLRRFAWIQTLEEQLPTLLAQSRGVRPGELRFHTRLGPEPRLLACQVVQDPAPRGDEPPGFLLLAFEVDFSYLVREVLRTACGSLRVELEEDAAIAILDEAGLVRAYAGADASPDPASGRLPVSPGRGATLSLDALPAWTLRVIRPQAQLDQARTLRLVLYVSLIGLTLVTAVAGAVATVRYVERSLELAKMKSDFLSNITHELKTPLTSIRMYGEMLALGRLRTEDKRKEYAEHIVREANRLQKLIDDILDFARQDAGNHDYVLAEEDVADTVAEAIDLFRHSAKVRGFDLFVELPPVGQLPPVDLDRDAIVRSVLNLLSNAVKYSTDDRYVKVVVRRDDAERLAISVADHGIGIERADLERIFDRFYRAGDELTRGVAGAGLGLSLVDTIVRAHGGEILAESEKGAGSEFTILLPIVEDYREQWPPPDPEDPGLSASATSTDEGEIPPLDDEPEPERDGEA